MSQVDFAVAFLMIISVITYSVVSTSNKLTGDFAVFTESRLSESASSLSKQLLGTNDAKSLMTSFKKIHASFQDIGAYQHTEILKLTLTPAQSDVHVYDRSWNEIPSATSGENVSFDLEFSAAEKKYVMIIYDGGSTSKISFEGTNVTGTILSEEDVYVMSQQRCDSIRGMAYDEAKESLGLSENFNVSECNIGLAPPLSANVIVKSVPVMIEKDDGSIYPNFVRIKVW
jgi:hypothetical protein